MEPAEQVADQLAYGLADGGHLALSGWQLLERVGDWSNVPETRAENKANILSGVEAKREEMPNRP